MNHSELWKHPPSVKYSFRFKWPTGTHYLFIFLCNIKKKQEKRVTAWEKTWVEQQKKTARRQSSRNKSDCSDIYTVFDFEGFCFQNYCCTKFFNLKSYSESGCPPDVAPRVPADCSSATRVSILSGETRNFCFTCTLKYMLSALLCFCGKKEPFSHFVKHQKYFCLINKQSYCLIKIILPDVIIIHRCLHTAKS